MILLHPKPELSAECPGCHTGLNIRNWYMPGMRQLADGECPYCHKVFHVDLPTGHGLLYPAALDIETGEVFSEYGETWFSDMLRTSFARRNPTLPLFSVEEIKKVRHAILLNCVDGCYGHCLTKLFNAQHYLDNYPEHQVVVLIPKILRWLVPDGVAQIWTLDIPLKAANEWNDGVAEKIQRLVVEFETCALAIVVTQPRLEEVSIERFTGVQPFPYDEWMARWNAPVVTFVWREDRPNRCWSDYKKQKWEQIIVRLQKKLGFVQMPVIEQKNRIIELAARLQKIFPALDFAITGFGTTGRFPKWIRDLRVIQITEAVERQWCEQHAASHVVLGVSGSNMILPSAHAGSVIDLFRTECFGGANTGDLCIPFHDLRDVMTRLWLLPIDVSVEWIVEIIRTLICDMPEMHIRFHQDWTNQEILAKDLFSLQKEQIRIRTLKRKHLGFD